MLMRFWSALRGMFQSVLIWAIRLSSAIQGCGTLRNDTIIIGGVSEFCSH